MNLSLVTLINNYDTYLENVVKSVHGEINKYNVELSLINDSKSASEGLNRGIKKAKCDLVLCCHQDVKFLDGWYDKLMRHVNMLDKDNNVFGVCGTAGTTFGGRMVGTHSGLSMDNLDSIQVQTLDCCTLLFRKSVFEKYKMKFDENLIYYHMYGEDISLQSYDKGIGVYALDVPIQHNTKWTSGKGFVESTHYMRDKWKNKFPVIHTTVGDIQ